jgi:hypothetical protein
MTRPPTNNYNNDLSAFDQTSPLPASTMTMNNINDVLQKIKEQVEAGNLRGAAAQVRELYIMSDSWQPDRRGGGTAFSMLAHVAADVAAALDGAAAAAKTPHSVPVAGEEVQTTTQELHLHCGHGGLNGDADQKPSSVPDTGAKVKKALPHHSQRGGLNGCNLFKQYKKYCIVKREVTLDDFVENLFAYAKEVRNRSVCKSDDALAQGLARAGAGGINARLLNMWKGLSPEQRQEYNVRALEIKYKTAIILRGKHYI